MKYYASNQINRTFRCFAVSFMGDHPEIGLEIEPADDTQMCHTIKMWQKDPTLPFPKTLMRKISSQFYTTPRLYELGVISAAKKMYQKLTDNQIYGQMSLFQEAINE